jgi:gamma-glutamyltranspeptidase / glutathione hydrolase
MIWATPVENGEEGEIRMEFGYSTRRRWSSAAQRSVVTGRRGMVASSQHLATAAGFKTLLKGGNAVDAAVAMLATLGVVEPHSVGIGGDAFALIYMAKDRKLVGMNGSGRAPYRANLEWFAGRRMREMPERGILSVTVPGALHGWAEAVERYGSMKLGALLEDAIFHAEGGFAVTEVIAGEWESATPVLRSNRAAADTFLPGGTSPRPGELFANPDLARVYRRIAEEGVEALYAGELARAIVNCSERLGGLLGHDDFRDHTTTWVEPLSTDYRGYTVYELPPNGQGIVALEMLNILEGYDIRGMDHNGPDHLHLTIEVKKAAFEDRDRWIADPAFESVPVDRLCSKDYAAKIRDRIRPEQAFPVSSRVPAGTNSETVYVTAVDEQGNAASFISSLFLHFGSGVVADGTGIVLQNRGSSFTLDPAHPNRIAPHKRPLHTIIPGMVFKDGELAMSFGVMGGDMQPQGHVQFLMNVIDFGMNLQEAMDVPRVRHVDGMSVHLEEGISEETASALERRGHRIDGKDPQTNQVGGGQAIYRDRESGVLLGASDRRKDGCAMGH